MFRHLGHSLALLCCLLAGPLQAATDWTFLAMDPRTETSLWLDEGSIRENGTMVDATYSISYVHEKAIPDQPGGKFRSIRAISRFNCGNGTVAYIHGLYYSGEFAKGHVVYDDSEEQMKTEGLHFDPVAPDSIGEFLLIRLCKLEAEF
jgi:hypothetical protein